MSYGEPSVLTCHMMSQLCCYVIWVSHLCCHVICTCVIMSFGWATCVVSFGLATCVVMSLNFCLQNSFLYFNIPVFVCWNRIGRDWQFDDSVSKIYGCKVLAYDPRYVPQVVSLLDEVELGSLINQWTKNGRLVHLACIDPLRLQICFHVHVFRQQWVQCTDTCMHTHMPTHTYIQMCAHTHTHTLQDIEF